MCQAQTFFSLVASIILQNVPAESETNRNMGVLLCILTALPVVVGLIMEIVSGDVKDKKMRFAYKAAKLVAGPVVKKLLVMRDERGRKRRKMEIGELAREQALANAEHRRAKRTKATRLRLAVLHRLARNASKVAPTRSLEGSSACPAAALAQAWTAESSTSGQGANAQHSVPECSGGHESPLRRAMGSETLTSSPHNLEKDVSVEDYED